jgi:ABC-type branched-subunit amino acid transport system ATPase component
MLDELRKGLAPPIVNDEFLILEELKEQGKAILLVAQNAKKALVVADYANVLERDRIIQDGSGPELRDDPAIVQAYLGG